MDLADLAGGGTPIVIGTRRLAVAAMVVAGAAGGGCYLVPAADVRTFMVELAPKSEAPLDEALLAEAIRTETEVEDFEFAETLEDESPRVPAIFAHFIRLVAGR